LQGDPKTDLERQLSDVARLLELVRDLNGETTAPAGAAI
jgi:hypothetical protein